MKILGVSPGENDVTNHSVRIKTANRRDVNNVSITLHELGLNVTPAYSHVHNLL